MPRRFFGRGTEGDEVQGSEETDEILSDEELDTAASPDGIPADEEDTAEVTSLRAELAEAKDKYVRTLADLENIKKRNARERSELQRYAGEYLARDLLVVLDDLQRASSQDSSVPIEEFLTGIRMIVGQFSSIFEKHGIISTDALGQPFDPKVHEALAMIPNDQHPSGTVVEQLKKAYFFRDKLLRPAQVAVSTTEKRSDGNDGPEPSEAEDEE